MGEAWLLQTRPAVMRPLQRSCEAAGPTPVRTSSSILRLASSIVAMFELAVCTIGKQGLIDSEQMARTLVVPPMPMKRVAIL